MCAGISQKESEDLVGDPRRCFWGYPQVNPRNLWGYSQHFLGYPQAVFGDLLEQSHRLYNVHDIQATFRFSGIRHERRSFPHVHDVHDIHGFHELRW